MRKVLFVIILFSLKAQAASQVYLSPISVGVMNTMRSSGEPGADSALTLGAEALVERNQILFGAKFDHIENAWEGDSVMGVRNKKDLLLLQVGYKILPSDVSPYAFIGGGAFFQTVYSRLFSVEETNSTIMFGYKLGVGVLARFSDKWGANLGIHYYPQSFVNGFNYVLSVGFIL